MNALAPIGHNSPPSPIETCIAAYEGIILAATNWADGQPVTDDAGMNAINAILKQFKSYKTALPKAAKEC